MGAFEPDIDGRLSGLRRQLERSMLARTRGPRGRRESEGPFAPAGPRSRLVYRAARPARSGRVVSTPDIASADWAALVRETSKSESRCCTIERHLRPAAKAAKCLAK